MVTPTLEVMRDAECTRRLKANDLGRIALVDREPKPRIFPVNHQFDEGVVVFSDGNRVEARPRAWIVRLTGFAGRNMPA